MERKQTENAVITAVDEDKGIVEAVWAVMGNIDDGNDIIHPGAFTKTFNERGNQIKLLDNHRASSVMDSLGLVKELRELRGAELPQEIMDRYPDATGGAWGKFQFLIDTPEGKGAFTRLKAGAVRGWSFGYDAVDKDHSTVTKEGQQIPVRNLRQIKLYEISPVLFAMNEATVTTGVKNKPAEGKPYGVVEEDGSYNVYKLDSDGKPTGKPLGKHDSEDDADKQVAALYAQEEDGKGMHDYEEEEEDEGKAAVTKTEEDGEHPASHYLVTEDPQKPSTWHLRVRNVDGELDHRLMGGAWAALHEGYRGNVYEGPDKQEAIRELTRFYEQEEMTPPGKSGNEPEDEKAGRVLSARNIQRIMSAMNSLHEALAAAGVMLDDNDDGPSKSKTPTPDGAGPPEDKDTYLRLIEIELEEMEV